MTTRRPLDPRIREIVENLFTFKVLLLAKGGVPYAGDDPNPRPLPATTLSDCKRNSEAALQAAHARGVRHIENALYFAFYSDRVKGEEDRSIAVPRDDLWWLASAGDTILLSDKVTHHYTTIYDVDRDAGRVSFLDQWPDRFFLKEGLNALGVAAKLVGNKPISITREEFRRVAVGLITMDTPSLLEDYFAQHPERSASVDINLSCGLCLLDVEKERFARVAAPYLLRALKLAEQERLQPKALQAASKLFVALTVAIHQVELAGEPVAARSFQDELRGLTSRFLRDDLVAGLDADDLCRMGNAAGNAKQVKVARNWFDRAVTTDPAHEQARWLRAIACDQLQDFEASAADAEEAVRLNIARVEAINAERDALDPRDRWGRGAAESRILSMTRRRAEEYRLSFRAHLERERWDLARRSAEAVIALEPEAADGYKRMAALEHRLGHPREMKLRIRQAIEREKDFDARQALQRLLETSEPIGGASAPTASNLLGVERHIRATRAELLAAQRLRALSPEEASDLQFHDGMAAFEQAIAGGGAGEDSEPEPIALRQAVDKLRGAACAYNDQGRTFDAADAHFQVARALQQCTGNIDSHREAAEHYRTSLALLDIAAHPALAFEANLYLGEVLQGLAAALVGEPREAELRRALAVLQAAEFLAGGLNDPARNARHKRITSLALGERFRPDRDENLLDSIALAEEALPYFRKYPDRAPIEYGSLLVQVGNSWLKVGRDRKGALEHARAAFSEGAGAIDSRRFPRLHRVLLGNLAMTEQLIAHCDLELPEKEMVGRFDAAIHASLDNQLLSEALQNGWAFLRWGWSLSQAPNVHVGAAHKILGNLYFRRGETAAAETHLYCALAVLSAELDPTHRWFPMVGQARDDLALFFKATNRPDCTIPTIEQAGGALTIAQELCRTGEMKLQTDPAAALTDFEESLRRFPCSPDALSYRGVVRMQAGDFPAALADFDASLLYRPRNIPALGNRFSMRLKLGDREGALADCDTMLEIDPEHDAALLHRATLKTERNDWDGVIADYSRLLELHPDATPFRIYRAAAREKKGDIAGAIGDLEQALAAIEEAEVKQAISQRIAELRARK